MAPKLRKGDQWQHAAALPDPRRRLGLLARQVAPELIAARVATDRYTHEGWAPGSHLEHRAPEAGSAEAARDLGEVEVAIVGGGISAIVMAIKLIDDGINSFVIFEKGSDLGGCWFWNRYPGCACDVSSYVYLPYLDRSRYCPPLKYVSQSHILEHLHILVNMHGLRQHCVFESKVTSAVCAEAAPGGPRWTLRTERGDTCSAKFLVCAIGFLSTPLLPNITGMRNFQGLCRHSSHWQEGDLERCRGRTVAIVGTGSSAIQMVPELAAVASHLYVIQRTPSWVAPRMDAPTTEAMRQSLLDKVALAKMSKQLIDDVDVNYNQFIQNSENNALMQARFSKHIRSIVKDAAVAKALTPNYPVGCKRLAVADTYYPTFNMPNVTLVAGHGGVQEVTPNGVRLEDGSQCNTDVLVMATGFDAFLGAFQEMEIHGCGGRRLSEEWGSGPRSLYGMYAGPSFPNLACLLGPQSPGIIANVTEVVQRQTDQLMSVIRRMHSESMGRVYARLEAVQRYTAATNAFFPGSVWSKCHSWYNRPKVGESETMPEDGGIAGWVGLFRDYSVQFQDNDMAFDAT